MIGDFDKKLASKQMLQILCSLLPEQILIEVVDHQISELPFGMFIWCHFESNVRSDLVYKKAS